MTFRITLLSISLLGLVAEAHAKRIPKPTPNPRRAIQSVNDIPLARIPKPSPRPNRSAGACTENSAVTTVYNLPQEDKPETWAGFKSFKASVNMQGSGRRKDGKIQRYAKSGQKPVTIPKSCKTTNTGSSGECLLSYFSIAADPKHWKMGDIIYMPALADQEIELPSGRIVRHPGFLIVHDTGGAIKGPNRFDFFIGPESQRSHSFRDYKMQDKNICQGKSYEKIDRDSPKYHDALAQIYENQDSDTSRGGVPGDGGGSQVIAAKGTK